MADAEFLPVRPFDIDQGQLDGMTKEQCFVLGYEVAMIDQLLDTGVAFEKPVHSANRDRIAAECQRRGRAFNIDWMEGDRSEDWQWLLVTAADDRSTS